MGKVRFNLNKNRDGSFTIFMVLRHNHERIKISVKEKITKRDWNFNEGMPKKSFFAYMELKRKLRSFEKKTEKYLLSISEIVKSRDVVKRDLVELLFPKLSGDDLSFFDRFADFIEIKLDDAKRKTASTNRYITLFRKLLDYDSNLTYDAIDLDWYMDWIKALEKQNYSKNYISSLSKGFKAFLAYSYDFGWTTNQKWKSKRFNYAGKPADNIYLNTEELQSLFEFDFVDKGIQNAVWLFLLSSYTGLRFGDMIKIEWNKNIIKKEDGIEYIKLTTSKTGELVAFPLHPIVKHIIENVEVVPFTNKTVNEYIKHAAKIVGIDETISIEINKGGKTFVKRYKKYEKITTHTARRSFATNAYKAGIPAALIMKITGHKSEKQFFEYIKISTIENAKILSMHEFFNAKLNVIR